MPIPGGRVIALTFGPGRRPGDGSGTVRASAHGYVRVSRPARTVRGESPKRSSGCALTPLLRPRSPDDEHPGQVDRQGDMSDAGVNRVHDRHRGRPEVLEAERVT